MGKLYQRYKRLPLKAHLLRHQKVILGLRRLKFVTVLLSAMLLWSGAAQAGGALKTNINGLPMRWESVLLNPEQGALKSGVYDNGASVALVQAALDRWKNIATVNLNTVMGSPLSDGGNTHASNYKDFYNSNVSHCYDADPSTPCTSPLIFDEDGSIIEDMFGECTASSIIGFAGFSSVAGDSDDPALTTLKRGYAVFNGACIAPAAPRPGCPPCNSELSHQEVESLITHEIGHLLGLGHSQVNADSYQACIELGFCPEALVEHIPTMYPFMVLGANMLSLHRDDEVSMQRLYGDANAGHCRVSGRVLNEGGATMRGVEVTARNTNPELMFTDAISYVAGERAPRINAFDKGADNCLENCGDFEISGLQAGQTYQLCVSRLSDKFTGTRFVAPVDPPRQDFDNDCPQGLTVTCECPAGDCSDVSGVEITVRDTGVDYNFAQLDEVAPSSSGCSLIKPLKKPIWPVFKRAFLSKYY